MTLGKSLNIPEPQFHLEKGDNISIGIMGLWRRVNEILIGGIQHMFLHPSFFSAGLLFLTPSREAGLGLGGQCWVWQTLWESHCASQPVLRPQSYFNLDLLKWKIVSSVLLDPETKPAWGISRHLHSRCWGDQNGSTLSDLALIFLKLISWQPHVLNTLSTCYSLGANHPFVQNQIPSWVWWWY